MNNPIVLKNVRILNFEQKKFSHPHHIIIKNGQITEICSDLPPQFPEAWFIDANGRYAVPGLWECHAHFADYTVKNTKYQKQVMANFRRNIDDSYDDFVSEQLSTFIRHGVTHVRDVGGPLDALGKLSKSIHDGVCSGPEIHYAGPMLEKPPLTWEDQNMMYPGFTEAIEKTQDVDSMLNRLISGGATLAKLFFKFDPELFEYFVIQAQNRDFPVTHDPGGALYHSVSMDMAINFGITCFEHAKSPLPVMLKNDWAIDHDRLRCKPPDSKKNREFFRKVVLNFDDALSKDKLTSLAKTMVDNDVLFCPTLHTLNEVKKVAQSHPETDLEKLRQSIHRSFLNINKMIMDTMIHQGVKLLVGHDGCDPNGTHEEMELLEEWGLPPLEIIKGAGTYAAQWLGCGNLYGTIDEGKTADIVVVNENPLSKITNLKSVFGVLNQTTWIQVEAV